MARFASGRTRKSPWSGTGAQCKGFKGVFTDKTPERAGGLRSGTRFERIDGLPAAVLRGRFELDLAHSLEPPVLFHFQRLGEHGVRPGLEDHPERLRLEGHRRARERHFSLFPAAADA